MCRDPGLLLRAARFTTRLVLIFILLLVFHGRVRVVRTMFVPCVLHGAEASLLSQGSFFLSCMLLFFVRSGWSARRQPLAGAGAVLGMLDGPQGVILLFGLVQVHVVQAVSGVSAN